MARTLAALQAAGDAPPVLPARKRPLLRPILKVAAGVLVVAGGVFALSQFLLVGSPLAFAEVVQKFRNARTLAYQVTVRSPQSKAPITQQVFLKEPGWMRTEMPGGLVCVGQRKQGSYKVLTLDPNTKTALLLEGKVSDQPKEPAAADSAGLADQLRQLVEKEGQPAGKKRIGDVQALGFRVKEGPQEWLVWADPQTRLPIRVEVNFPRQDIQVVLSEFRFNPVLKEALFRQDVPRGYQLQAVEMENPTAEQALVRVLRAYAKASGGKFPKRLDDPAAFAKVFPGGQGEKAKGAKPFPGPEDMRLMTNFVRVVQFVLTHPQGYGYQPDGVKEGDAGKILLWYRPEKATKYRALYGDLHWADVTTDLLPEVPWP
jgi:outer membrane lipoprotein-sorting protein